MGIKSAIFWGAAFACLLHGTEAAARPFRVNQVPNGTVNSCLTCHESPGGPRNAFGATIEFDPRFLDMPGGNVLWQPALAAIDSDGDGRTNGTELLDPAGTWSVGMPSPGNAALVTRPGTVDAAPPPPAVPALPWPLVPALFATLSFAGARALSRGRRNHSSRSPHSP